jgi:hypothetical protein
MNDGAKPAGPALTGRRAKTIFAAMRPGNPLKLLLQVLSLAAMSLALSMGSAFAHGDHHQATAHSAATHADHRTDEIADVAPGVAVIHAPGDAQESAPCHGESSGHGTGEGCCTIACHAALAAPAIDPIGAVDLPRTRIVDLVDRLEGRPSGRTERPPKRS